MRIVISGIPIDVQKKNIKNMHLQVKPPDGHVVISAPLSVDDKAIEAYARTQLGFIKRAIAQFQEQPRASRRQYVSGETMYIWGKQYFLVFKSDNQKNSFEIQNQNIVLSMSAKSTVKQRDAYVKEEYRKILKEEIEKRLPKWEAQTGLKCDSWQTKYMVTKWGACSTDKKKLWFNLQLAQKPYAWENEGWPMPVVEESYNPDRTRLSLEFAKKQTIKTSEEEKEPKRSQKGAEKEPIKGAERKKEILKLIKVNSTITQVEIMKELDLTRKQVQKDMKELQEMHIIAREGTNRRGRWIIVKENK